MYKYILIALIICVQLSSITSCTEKNSQEKLSGSDDSSVPAHIRAIENVRVFDQKEQLTPVHDIRFSFEQTFGSTDSVLVMVGGSDRGLIVDRFDKVFIRDNKNHQIHVFDGQGEYVKGVGRPGRGPSEFLSIHRLDENDTLIYARDAMQYKLNVFSMESLEFVKSISTDPKAITGYEELTGYVLRGYYVRNDGTLLVFFEPSLNIEDPLESREKYKTKYYLLNENWEIISDLIYEHESYFGVNHSFQGRMHYGITFPFDRKTLTTISKTNNDIISAWTDEFLIKVYDEGGNYKRAIYYPYENALIDREALIERYDFGYEHAFFNTLKTMEMPETWPALESIFVDDEDRMWVKTIVHDQSKYQYWVLDYSGELLARFTWPRDKRLEYVRNGYVYTWENTEEERVVNKYEIIFES
ncbi:6-bladed beta-propeller [Gracilimonas sp.]|uniref:6-bladed beta-propeller n=1 Tax=Gracilimonas sp. TaxID=1974203 RepID=UPI002872583C|nr:6-bladed beta-propeller [Gracilimonas sp.]